MATMATVERRKKRQRSPSPSTGNDAKKPFVVDYDSENGDLIYKNGIITNYPIQNHHQHHSQYHHQQQQQQQQQQQHSSRIFDGKQSHQGMRDNTSCNLDVGEASKSHSNEIMNYFQNIPVFGEILAALSPLWRQCLSTLLQRDTNCKPIASLAQRAAVINYGATILTLRPEDEEGIVRIIVCCLSEGAGVQVVLTRDRFLARDPHPDSESDSKADGIAEWLLMQMSSKLELKDCVNPCLWNCAYFRNFGVVKCRLKFFQLQRN